MNNEDVVLDANETSAPALKEIFNRERLQHIADQTKAVHPPLDTAAFMTLATADLESLGIMQRMRQVATSLHATLPGDYPANIAILKALAPRINHGFASISLAEYVALYGLDHFDLSMDALKYVTRFGSAEFAIRPFILANMPRALALMEEWSRDENEHVRRLACEGSRPRLPWSFQLKALIDDPEPVRTILDNLKTDEALYVRKSVANHLNDITKSNPDWVLRLIETWPKDNKHTVWIVRQALRTLIKKGHADALAHLGAHEKADIRLDEFRVSPESVALGNPVRISAAFTSTAAKPQKLVVDYTVHYVKKSGGASPKVFKWKEIDLQPGERVALSISRAIRDFTTRKHYAGKHGIVLVINGETVAETAFELLT
ncbi:DNA alkylation repair protein [Agrobacterium sp. rho-13.3]|uniref:DNA alkylation repair protein n=1 Tax=Agrobacterium sp. rho-13.3 TaxID=3072980 RepID=UPI002A0D5C73|nr:DNA alkylation repair protein [Agrobacterium sp. rho-13.3]MDX8307582.1 DNA alkylation repair protein [Agrobacterium sp. rho-13.3]